MVLPWFVRRSRCRSNWKAFCFHWLTNAGICSGGVFGGGYTVMACTSFFNLISVALRVFAACCCAAWAGC